MDLMAKLAAVQAKAEKYTINKNKEIKEHDYKSNSVTKSNALARSYYRFSLIEKRVMECLISQLHPMRMDNEIQEMELKALDYAKLFGVSEKRAYNDLSGAIDGLLNHVITVKRDNGYDKYPLMAKAEYRPKEGRIVTAFNPYMTQYLQALKGTFTKYPLKKAVNFKSSYTWRLYEIIVSWAQDPKKTDGIFAGWINIEVNELRKMLGVPDSYRWDHFKKRVLNVVENELFSKANIKIVFHEKKTGRKITHLKIEFIQKEKACLEQA